MIRNQLTREPQIALHLLAGQMHQTVARISRGVLRADTCDVLGEQECLPVQLTRSAITVAGIVGYAPSSARTASSICAHADVVTAARSYRGGAAECTALATVFRDRASCRAIAACDSFSDRYSRRISAQSSTVITLQSKGAHISAGITCSLFDRNRQIRSTPTNPPRTSPNPHGQQNQKLQ
jgi:hypothetical protein